MTKALSLWQTWAMFVALELKQYETRHWSTNYRGPLVIHAAKRWTDAERQILDNLCTRFDELAEYRHIRPALGAVVCACNLVAVHRVEDIRDDLDPLERALGNYADGRFAWELEFMRCPPQPIPARGQQGIWDWHPQGV